MTFITTEHSSNFKAVLDKIGIMFTVGNVDRYIGRRSGRQSIDTRSILDRHSVDCRSRVDRLSIECRSTVDEYQSTVDRLSKIGRASCRERV